MPVSTDSYSTGNSYTAAEAQAVAQAIDGSGWLQPVHCVTAGGETYTIVSGSVTVINGTTLDGVSPAVGDRILIMAAPAASGVGTQFSNQPGNGVYTVTNAATNLTVARAYEMSAASGAGTPYNPSGWSVTSVAGTNWNNQEFVVAAPSNPAAAMVYGTTTIAWAVQPNSTTTGRSLMTAASAAAALAVMTPLQNAVTAYVVTQETTTSTTYTDLTTTTDSVTVTIGSSGLAMVFLNLAIGNGTAADLALAGFALSGANTVAATDDYAVGQPSTGSFAFLQFGACFLLTGLAAGSTTFKMKYRVNASTGTFSRRRIAVIPL